MKKERDIIVFFESSGDRREEINQGLLAEGDRIASLLEGSLSVLSIGNLAEDIKDLDQSGVANLYLLEDEGLSAYSGEVFAWAVKVALQDIPFRCLLFAHTDRGGELAPRVASYLGTAAVSDCVDIRVRDQAIFYVRYVYGGQLEQEAYFLEPYHEIATIRPDSLEKRGCSRFVPLKIHHIPIHVPPEIIGPVSLGIIPPDYRTVDITSAKRIIGAGIGCADPELLDFVEELSHLLEGSIGTTRPVVDDGYLPKERMIGQTGKTVSPELYLALGISGSPHHVAGIHEGRKIISVNIDPRAPIFNVSDEGFVCDLRTLLPKLAKRIKQFRDEGVS
ncbi:MAG: electron transfer flavoprotein subunit alpha/FixB family protein [Deltaproteobacteria bacterium]|nr:electron transfer flavoprotein subunit alpha/FixB family protein [Deltaproteobacteria bacterium]